MTVNEAAHPVARALADLWDGLLAFQVWGVLGWSDVRRRYRRSVLGPLWITLSLAIFVGSLGYLYAQLFQRDLAVYLPHLTLGYITWTMLSSLLDSGAKCFINGEGVLKQMHTPRSVHAYRVIWATLLTTVHHIVIFAVVAIAFAIVPTLSWLLVIPGLALIILTAVPLSLLVGTASARFRDLPLIMQSATRILLFLTPVIWMPELVTRRAVFLTWNPFYHYIELIRAPLLNKPIDPLHWQFAGAAMVLCWIVALPVYARFRARIAYWL